MSLLLCLGVKVEKNQSFMLLFPLSVLASILISTKVYKGKFIFVI